MKKIRPLKCSLLIISAYMLINPVYGGYGGEGTKNKAEKISKYKTQRLTSYVNFTVNLLSSTEEKNERHFLLFKNCQKLLNGSKKTVKGKDKKNLKSCIYFMDQGKYYDGKNSLTDDFLPKNTNTKQNLKNKYQENNNFKNENRIKTIEDQENIRLNRLKEEQFKRLQEKQLKKLEEKQLKEKLLKEKLLKELKEKQIRELRELQERQIKELDEKKVKQLEEQMLRELKDKEIKDNQNKQKRIKKESNLLFN